MDTQTQTRSIAVELEDPAGAARQLRIEAQRLATAFDFCSPENQPADCAPAPIWQTIRDLRQLADAIEA
jgi:hypothetical protein